MGKWKDMCVKIRKWKDICVKMGKWKDIDGKMERYDSVSKTFGTMNRISSSQSTNTISALPDLLIFGSGLLTVYTSKNILNNRT